MILASFVPLPVAGDLNYVNSVRLIVSGAGWPGGADAVDAFGWVGTKGSR